METPNKKIAMTARFSTEREEVERRPAPFLVTDEHIAVSSNLEKCRLAV
jgi:hypothetical protein